MSSGEWSVGFTGNWVLATGNCTQGAVAQLGERLVCNQEATGSIPVSSTNNLSWWKVCHAERRMRSRSEFIRSRSIPTQPALPGGYGDLLVRRRRVNRIFESILGLGPFLIPIVAIIVGGAIAITGMAHRHAERLAKIERGIDPDASPRG